MRALTLLVGLMIVAPAYADQNMFNALAQDTNLITAVRSEDNNIWIKLASAILNDEITVHISSENKDYYR